MSIVVNPTGQQPAVFCVIPAAGVGKRMKSSTPKQYLTIDNKTILQHTIERMQSIACVKKVVVAISPDDQYFQDLQLSRNVEVVHGGAERVDSVLQGLKALGQVANAWVLVHDAARPNVSIADVEKLVETCLAKNCGGILATPVRDTMKRGSTQVQHTEPREDLWHALTPQFFPLQDLLDALEQGLAQGINITDEASAVEHVGKPVLLVEGRADNLKITRPEDLALATFFLNQQGQ